MKDINCIICNEIMTLNGNSELYCEHCNRYSIEFNGNFILSDTIFVKPYLIDRYKLEDTTLYGNQSFVYYYEGSERSPLITEYISKLDFTISSNITLDKLKILLTLS